MSQKNINGKTATQQKSGSGIKWTAANIVTCVRVVLVPVWLFLAEVLTVVSDGKSIAWGGIVVFAVYVFLSLTDKIDGYLARSRGEVTVFGKFLDQIADKLLVVTGMVWLLSYGIIPVAAVVIVVAREFLVSGLRMVVASKGTVIAASNLGKWKTATTMISLCGYMLVMTLPQSTFAFGLLLFCHVMFIAAMALTAWSGIDYFMKSKDALGED